MTTRFATKLWRWTAPHVRASTYQNSWDRGPMARPLNQHPTVGYVVSAWPRLSETFILNEVLAVERLGLRLRIFSIKDPKDEPVHAKVAQVRAPVSYLSMQHNRKAILQASARLLFSRPVRWCRTLLRAMRYRRWGGLRCFLQASYLAEMVSRERLSHLHAHFAHNPTVVAMFTHQLTGVPYSFT